MRRIIHYIIYTIIRNKEIGIFKKNGFFYFGKNSIICKPYLQLKQIENIKIGENTTILQNCRISCYEKSDKVSIEIGNNCYIGNNVSILSCTKSKIIIGDDTLIASNVTITNENHGMDPENSNSYANQELVSKDVEISKGCWIGERVCILPGVKIGEKSIVGAGSVVTKNIPDLSIAAGNPAKIIKKYDIKNHKWIKYYE